jgi:hypothetical protein
LSAAICSTVFFVFTFDEARRDTQRNGRPHSGRGSVTGGGGFQVLIHSQR